MKWIVLSEVLLALVVLVAAVRPLAIRLPRLQQAILTLLQRQDEARVLQHSALELQERVETLQQQAQDAHERLAVINAKRGR